MREIEPDVLIAGAGFTGLALALALRQGMGPGCAISVADPALAGPLRDERASAIAAGARRLFETLGVWQAVGPKAQPIRDMVVTDSKLSDVVRPVFLNFEGLVEPDEPFAHMVENVHLVEALMVKAGEQGIILEPRPVTSLEQEAAGVRVRCGERVMNTRLLVAADGARSRLRELAGIPTHGWSYGQSAIVAMVVHERDHQGRAIEHFLPAGPFAILPLTGTRSSIVWTEESREAERILALGAEAFQIELEHRFGLELGEISVSGRPRAYPLGFAVARSFIAPRLALVGDAAHVIHPIAGQGLNMGLRDIAALAETLVDAARLGLDVGSPEVLERYQRWRRFDTMTMGITTDALNRLFSNRSGALRLLRDLGLGVVDRLPFVKRAFIREAAGLVGDVPKLLRGQSL
jgi:2-octaprenyl-6-methoxyphenol hydroxylase